MSKGILQLSEAKMQPKFEKDCCLNFFKYFNIFHPTCVDCVPKLTLFLRVSFWAFSEANCSSLSGGVMSTSIMEVGSPLTPPTVILSMWCPLSLLPSSSDPLGSSSVDAKLLLPPYSLNKKEHSWN